MNVELNELLISCKKSGAISDALLRAIETFAKRILGATPNRDEIVQAVLIRFCKVWRRIDCSQNVSAYLATMVRNEKRMFFRSLNRKQRLFVNESRFATGLEFVAAEKFQVGEVRAICC